MNSTSGPVVPATVANGTSTTARPAAKKRRVLVFLSLAFASLGLGIFAVWAYYASSRNQLDLTIDFSDAYGLRNGADLRHRGVIVGRVTDVRVRPEAEGVRVRAKLQPEAEYLARTGSQFYIVRPTVSLNNGIRGLDAAIGDVYVEVTRPTTQPGERKTAFEGSEEPPVPDAIEGSRQFVLTARRRSHSLRQGAPVTCAGFEIGLVRSVELAEDGRGVKAILSIYPKRLDLIDIKSHFVEARPFIAEGSIANLKLNIDLMALQGGIEMVPPVQPQAAAPEGYTFRLND